MFTRKFKQIIIFFDFYWKNQFFPLKCKKLLLNYIEGAQRGKNIRD